MLFLHRKPKQSLCLKKKLILIKTLWEKYLRKYFSHFFIKENILLQFLLYLQICILKKYDKLRSVI